MNIGKLSQTVGISAKMIRYYEQIGLLDSAKRSASGYRIYSEQDLKTYYAFCFVDSLKYWYVNCLNNYRILSSELLVILLEFKNKSLGVLCKIQFKT